MPWFFSGFVLCLKGRRSPWLTPPMLFIVKIKILRANFLVCSTQHFFAGVHFFSTKFNLFCPSSYENLIFQKTCEPAINADTFQSPSENFLWPLLVSQSGCLTKPFDCTALTHRISWHWPHSLKLSTNPLLIKQPYKKGEKVGTAGLKTQLHGVGQRGTAEVRKKNESAMWIY